MQIQSINQLTFREVELACSSTTAFFSTWFCARSCKIHAEETYGTINENMAEGMNQKKYLSRWTHLIVNKFSVKPHPHTPL